MVNKKGIASYCQDCGLCSIDDNRKITENLVDTIVDEVVKDILNNSSLQTVSSNKNQIPLGVSNRHIHLTQETFKRLFGENAELVKYRDLYQAGDIAAKQMVTIVGSKMRAIQNVRILGPLRKYDQVELSLTDAVQLGIKPPIRNSGDLQGAAPLTLVGPEGSVFLSETAIIANRHIHLPHIKAQEFGLQDGDLCKVRIVGEKSTIFENVLIRINDAWKLQLHLDTDDANAANVRCAMDVEFYGKM